MHAFFFEPPIENNYIGHIVAEVFKDRVYAPYVEGKKGKVCLDIGGNLGFTAYYFSRYFDTVHVLEPAKEHYAVLTHQLEYNKLTNVIPHNIALANFDGEGQFYHLENKTMWSLRPAGVDNTQQHETVKTIRLDTFLKENNIEHVDFMKLDCEGSEADIICSESFQNAADKIDMIFIEVHAWLGRNLNQLKEGLKMAGFKTIETIPNEAMLWIARK